MCGGRVGRLNPQDLSAAEPPPSCAGGTEPVQEGVDGEGRVQFGTVRVLRGRGTVPAGSWGQGRGGLLGIGFFVVGVPMEDVRGEVLGKDGLILARHCCVLTLQELEGHSAHLHCPEVPLPLGLSRILQYLERRHKQSRERA